jgi:hypothetical protein
MAQVELDPAGRPMNTKDTIRELLDRLPDDCSLEDVLYHLYVLREIALGRADLAASGIISHDDVVRDLRRKWLLGAPGRMDGAGTNRASIKPSHI